MINPKPGEIYKCNGCSCDAEEKSKWSGGCRFKRVLILKPVYKTNSQCEPFVMLYSFISGKIEPGIFMNKACKFKKIS